MVDHVVRIEVDVVPAVEAVRRAQEAFMDAAMILLYHDDLCESEADVFI